MTTSNKFLLAAVVFTLLAVVFFGSRDSAPIAEATTQPIAGLTYFLSGAGVSSSATSITLTSFTIPQTGQKIQDSDVSDTFYVTIEPGNRTRQEIVGCTTVTQNGTSATLSGCSRGLSPITPYTASTTLAFTHAGGSQVIFSDPPQLFNQYGALANTQTITGTWTFSGVPPQISTNAVNPLDAVNQQTLAATAISGAATATEAIMGISVLSSNIQAASSTASTTTQKPLVLLSRYATTTPDPRTWANVIPVTSVAGQLSPLFIATTSPYTFATTTTFIANFGRFFATSSLASFIQFASTTALSTSGTASTSNLVASNIVTLPANCTGCTITAPVSTSTTFATPTTNGTVTSATAFCVAPKLVSGGGSSLASDGVLVFVSKSFPSSASAWTVQYICNNGANCAANTATVYAMCVNP